MGPLHKIIQFFDHYEAEEEAILNWVGTDDVSKCFALNFLHSVLEKKKASYKGKAILISSPSEEAVKPLEDGEIEAFEEWLFTKMATDSVQPNFNPGESSVLKTEGQAMMEHIKEWRTS
ncbi:unnamed protein product, partial [Cuscuta europaea]